MSSACRSVRYVAGLILLIAGCAGPGPRLFPPAPLRIDARSDGGFDRWYDTNRDRKPDYREEYSPQGLLAAIGYYRDQDGQLEEEVILDRIPESERRHLVILLDSVPHAVAQDLWLHGRFRYCPRPARVISPFPVMTDLSFSEFFGASPSPGIESEYYDGRQIRGGYWVYINEGNANWIPHTDYHMPQLNHGNAYLNVEPWFGHELRRIQKLFLREDRKLTIGYCVGTSGLGAMKGWNGHHVGMIMVDRLCQELLYQTRGAARITLLSDHGHFFTAQESRRLPLRDLLRKMGYRPTERIRGPRDLVIPEFEMVSAASIWTPMPARVARDVVGIEGVDLAAYMEQEQLVVVSREGLAFITRSEGAFRYDPQVGDPLRLRGVLEHLRSDGQVSPEGFVADRVLFDATLRHVYPDAIARLWRAFHGLVANTPDVIVAVSEGFHCGSQLQTDLVNLVGVHGNLGQASSNGFAITMAGELPADLRMEDLRGALSQLGVPFESRQPSQVGQ